mmetsp:Transcript_35545/g.36222  ORF Transcript_35545/g.36222 Transcript_35545/m.36222 type:complete len:297 (+) Transcript_35545:87-977(+)|eukprot:CAMPEP_0182427390 /NCGR_PEP_ID=MMETSP1167-20130531/17134_1 /TAXON_ID=2988 /ORGANISM="Mallomonas Sp, Strain CCMP3275" /LENGTH=296 /DNA_ID=CAMNT_0024609591 /DNA_START=80 /DNA_END=970 /DNA_ORIENTATION=-
MATLFHVDDKPPRVYWDRKYFTSFEQQAEALKGSSTLYVGNLSFYTTELQIHETFSRAGPIKRIIMGLNREKKTPCGFCFVEYYTHKAAIDCLRYISGTVCDDNIVRCELDAGFKPGRQYGRGKSGGQVRDERRQSYDSSRGGDGGGHQRSDFVSGKKRYRDNYDNNRRHSDRGERFGRDRTNSRSVTIEQRGGVGGGIDRELRAPRPKRTDGDEGIKEGGGEVLTKVFEYQIITPKGAVQPENIFSEGSKPGVEDMKVIDVQEEQRNEQEREQEEQMDVEEEEGNPRKMRRETSD